MQPIRVFVADDHAVLRSGLRLLIESQNDMRVVGEAGDFARTFDLLRQATPDVVTLDLTMPGGLGLSAIEKVREIAPRCHVIVLTMHDDPAYLRTALAMGASGYVVKSAADTDLLSAIRAVYQGRVFIDAREQHGGVRHSYAELTTCSGGFADRDAEQAGAGSPGIGITGAHQPGRCRSHGGEREDCGVLPQSAHDEARPQEVEPTLHVLPSKTGSWRAVRPSLCYSYCYSFPNCLPGITRH